MSDRASVGKQPSVRTRPFARSQSLIWARSAPTTRARCSASMSATARGSSERDRAELMSSSWRSSAARRFVSARFAAPLNAVPAWSARIISSRRSSSSNWRRPSFESVITPTSLPSCCIGTTSIDSSTSSVPGIVAPRGSIVASSMRSGCPCSATQPVKPSPSFVRRISKSTFSYSPMLPSNAIGTRSSGVSSR